MGGGMRKKKFILAPQPCEGQNKHAVAFALLFLFIGNLSATSLLLGYGFADMREDNNQSFLALGVTPYYGTYLCTNSISFLPNMGISGDVFSTDYVEMHYQGILTPSIVCYKNYTCSLQYVNGTYYRTISSSDPLSIFMNMTSVAFQKIYMGQCVVYDKIGGNATTEDRYLSIIGPPGTNVTNITNVINIINVVPGRYNTVDVIGIIALIIIILFCAAQFCDMRILGVFASLLLMFTGVIIMTSGIAYRAGSIVSGGDTYANVSASMSISGNVTYTNTTSIIYKNTTSTNTYAIMTVPYVNFSQTLGLILMLISMFGLLHYGLGVGRYLNQGK
jgi:hypothetical protein